jgi:hypothetical protein
MKRIEISCGEKNINREVHEKRPWRADFSSQLAGGAICLGAMALVTAVLGG